MGELAVQDCTYKEVSRIRYASKENSMGQEADVLEIQFTDGCVMDVPNGNFSAGNPAFCVMGYLGVSPSTLDEAGEKHLPVFRDAYGGLSIPQYAMNEGSEELKKTNWCPTDNE